MMESLDRIEQLGFEIWLNFYQLCLNVTLKNKIYHVPDDQ